ncbi:MAG: hypothetical protein ACLQNE_31840 [Thermoguttaceae bacterium]
MAKQVRKNRSNASKVRKKEITDAVDAFVAFLAGLPAFSFVFVTEDGTNRTGPNVISAIDLAECTFNGMNYGGPYPESQFECDKAEASKRGDETILAVEKQVRRLRKSGASFVLCWHAFGESVPYLDYSDDRDIHDVEKKMVCLLQAEVAWSISP